MAFKHIIDLNNMTVELLQRRDYIAAAMTSSKALRVLKYFQREISDLPSNEAHDSLDQCMLLATVNENRTSPAHAFIYRQGILLPPTMTDFTSVSAVLMFNSALAQQLCAETCPKESNRLLLKAKRMYELVSRLRGLVEQNALFQFVLVNNTAVIEAQVGDKQKSKTYFDFLMAIFMLFVDQECTQHLRQVRGFLRNMPKQHENAAAAA